MNKTFATIHLWFRIKIGAIRTIPFYVRGSWAIIKHAPLRVRIVLLLFVLYLVSPLDVIPNFIPVIGVLDDILVAFLMGRYVYKNLPELAEFWHLPAPKPSRKQRIAELELTVAALAGELAVAHGEADMYFAAFNRLNEAVNESTI